MIARVFTPPKSIAWDQWLIETQVATKALIDKANSGAKITGDDIVGALYRSFKKELFAAFHGKCAFCEGVIANDQPGDVEHYRPKCGVLDADGNVVPNHNGYYWLAYDWKNLLPSCADCNRGRYGTNGEYFGKGELFPVKGVRAVSPGQEDLEEPLLLNPTIHEPSIHLKFDPRTGLLAGSTEEGRATIKILGLNRERLPEARRKMYSSVKSAFVELAACCFLNEERATELLNELDAHKLGTTAYSLAAQSAFNENAPKIVSLAKLLSK